MTGSPSIPTATGTLVIGAGTGGAALAGVLARESDEEVLLLEAGPDYGPRDLGQWAADTLDARAIPLSHDWGLSTTWSDGLGGLDLPRAKILGGCSAHNGCTASLGARFDYDEWAAAGNTGWAAEDVEPVLDWVHDQFRVRRYTTEELTFPQHAFVEAGIAAGLPFADDLDDLAAAEGIGPMPINIVDGDRYNSAFAFLDPARTRPNLTIRGGATVRRLLITNGTVHGAEVDVDGNLVRVHAKRVVLAAGAYHSPALLLASGIGAAAELDSLGIPLVQDLPGVGKHLLDHVCIALDFAGQDGFRERFATLPWTPDEQTVGRTKSSLCDEGPYDIHVFMVAGANSGHPGLPPITLYGGAMRAKSEGTVTLGPDLDPTRPIIDHRYGSDPQGHDRQVLAESLALLQRMTTYGPLAEILGDPVPRGSGNPLTDLVNYCHPAGSCKMGPSEDPTAVVDATGQVHGVSGLYIADASIMPAITRGNINLPTAMIGAHIAHRLLGTTIRTRTTATAA